MKKGDLKTGVVYAFKDSKYGGPDTTPVVLLSLDLYRLNKESGFLSKGVVEGEPRYRLGGKHDTRPDSGNAGYHSSPVAYLAVSTARVGYDMSNRQVSHGIPLHRLREVTLEEALASTVKGAKKVDYEVCLVDNRFLKGEYDDVQGEIDMIVAAQKEADAKAKAEMRERVVVAQKRVEALRALGLPGEIENASATPGTRWSADEWKPLTFTKTNVDSIRLSAGQIDALLSLVPEGAKVVETDVEDDGWTLKKPEFED